MTADDMVLRMARQMGAEMRTNENKGERWIDGERDELEFELLYHAVKLLWAGRAADKAAVLEYAADVANHAGMLAARLGALEHAPQDGNASSYLEGSQAARNLAEHLHAEIRDPPL